MHEVATAASRHCVQQASCRHQIVAVELRFHQAADLGMADDDRVGAVQRLFPGARIRHVGLHHLDIRVKLAQDTDVGCVLVDSHNGVAAALFQAGDQILTDQAGRTGDNDLQGSVPPSIMRYGGR